ncbi:MAG: histidine kinase [Calditrichaeota bacterium]|nr:histidine kinase [Calditrichota bacterium]
MAGAPHRLLAKVRKYHFQLRHLTVAFAVLVLFQLFATVAQKRALKGFLYDTQEWYQRDFAERQANLTASAFELVLETALQNRRLEEASVKKIVQAFNIILSQQLLQQHVQEVCILVSDGPRVVPIDNGHVLFEYVVSHSAQLPPDRPHPRAVELYQELAPQLISSEQTLSRVEGGQNFHVFVPLVPKGEYFGALYMLSTPQFHLVSAEILAGYNETGLISIALILLGFLAMFYISSYTVRERDEAQQLLFQERERQIREHMHYQKEALFAKRIYHTHHKAEKVMGFIKEDLELLSPANIEQVRERVRKYANFISRVIYDMKWYEPPLHTVRNPAFRTSVNDVVRFVVQNIFLRLPSGQQQFRIELDLDERVPPVAINEFVVWEIIEPLLQNAIDHSGNDHLVIRVSSTYQADQQRTLLTIADNGPGVRQDLLETDERGVRRLFLENVTTKSNQGNSGYGCYIAHELCTQRCGWAIDVENLPEGGCQFTIVIPHEAVNETSHARAD